MRGGASTLRGDAVPCVVEPSTIHPCGAVHPRCGAVQHWPKQCMSPKRNTESLGRLETSVKCLD